MASIAKLVVSLGASTGKFETDMQRASRNQQKRMRDMERTAKAAAKGLAVAFTAVSGAMTAVVTSTIRTADSMAKLGQRLGVSTEALSELGYVAEKSGIDFRTLEMGLQRMTRRIGEVAFLGKGEAKVALETLGLSARKLAELPLDKQFEAIAEQLSNVENTSQRTSLAMKIFDAEGVKLVQMMEGGAAAIGEMRQELQQTGDVISGDLARNAETFTNNLALMERHAKGAGTQFTAGVLPALIDVQAYFLSGAEATDFFREAGEKLGRFLKGLVGSFIILRHAVEALIRLLIAAADLIYQAFKAIAAPIVATTQQIAKAFDDLAKGNISDALSSLGDIAQQSGKKYNKAVGGMERATQEMADAAAHVAKGVDKALDVMAGTETQAKKTIKPVTDLADGMEGLGNASEKAAEKQREAENEAEKFQERLQSIMDTLFPLDAQMREFDETVSFLTEAWMAGHLTVVQYTAALQKLAAGMVTVQDEAEDTKDDFDLLTVAMDEGVRILERTFTSLWENMLSGASDAFDTIKDGFRSLLANLANQASTQKISLGIQDIRQNGFSQAAMMQIGEGVAAYAGTILGASLGGGGQGATIGATIGVIGGSIAGAFAGPVGVMIGSVIGGAIGGVLGGLFDSDRPTQLNASGNPYWSGLSGSDDERTLDTLFGRTFITTRRADEAAVAEFMQGIEDFDNAIASFLTTDQIGSIADKLKEWDTHLTGDAISLEALLESRFGVILSTFSDGIQSFVRDGIDLTDQVDRLQVGVKAQDLMDAAPDLFSGKTLDQFLAVVSGFQSGSKSIVEAFQEVLVMLDQVASVKQTLRDYADSDLAGEFQAILDASTMSLTEAVAGMNSALQDAILNFDGTPEQLAQIGQMVSVVREGELKLLAQIDSISKGIQANLDQLEKDVRGVTEPAKTGEQLLTDAEGFAAAIKSATSAEEIAALERDFSAAIRAMSPEDWTRLQTDILSLIETFRTDSEAQLDGMRQVALENAEAMRDMVDGFEAMVDPLDVIAASNQQAADALSAIESGSEEKTKEHHNRTEEILEGGVGDITDAVEGIGPEVAGAIRGAFAGMPVIINLTVAQDGNLVNE